MQVAVVTFHTVRVGAQTSHMDGPMYRANARFGHGVPSYVCCGHTVRLFLSSVLAGRVCTAPHDRPEGEHERDASTLRGGNFGLFHQDPASCRERRTHRASVLTTHLGSPVDTTLDKLVVDV